MLWVIIIFKKIEIFREWSLDLTNFNEYIFK